jgi:hypothetical protein
MSGASWRSCDATRVSMGLYVSVCGPGDGFGQPDRHSPAGGGVVVHSRVEEDAQSVEVVYHSQSAGLRVRLPETQRRRQSNPPTLPNTGPTFARSLAIHIANPSPKRLCALPSTWACQHIHRADLRNAVHLEFPSKCSPEDHPAYTAPRRLRSSRWYGREEIRSRYPP